MKQCPQCHKQFPDNAAVCPHDGTPLKDGTSLKQASPTSRSTRARSASREQTSNQQSATPQSTAHRRTEAPASSPANPNATNDLVGRTFFGEYTISKKLGEGGMGAVYLARQNAIDQNVALKVLHAKAAESDEIIQRFHREAKVISMLTHPNIVRVFIFGRTPDNLLYLVMEYVQGRELRDQVDAVGTLDELLAIKIMKQTCSALAEAHDLGIIHRDLKPDNILLTEFRGENNFVKILDFGIAKLNEPDETPDQKLTKAGIVYGTPEYLSPEQAQAKDLDRRTDIYSMGCILYELITGRVPFTDSNPVQILTKHVFEDPPLPSEVSPDTVAPTMERIITKAMAKEPDERFDDAMMMFEALVAREREIIAERDLSSKDTYFPGSELTGLHRASDVKRAVTDQDLQRDGGSSATLENAKTATFSAQPADQPARQELAPPSKRDGANDDLDAGGNPKIIIVAIGVLVFILLVLVGVISMLLFTN